MMYQALLHSHSGLRWIVLGLLIVTIVKAFMNGRIGKLATWTMISMHIQLVIGVILYFFVSPRTSGFHFDMSEFQQRFFGVEHPFMMLIAIILVTLGHRAYKSGSINRFKWLYVAALLCLLAGIPWPMMLPSANWF